MDVAGLTEIIAAGFGALTSLGFKFIPALDDWLYNKVSDNNRGLVMLGISATVPLAILAVSCVGLYDLVPCTPDIWRDLVRAWIAFVTTNVGLFMMTKDSKAKQTKKLLSNEQLNIGVGRTGVPHPLE